MHDKDGIGSQQELLSIGDKIELLDEMRFFSVFRLLWRI